LKKRSRLTGRRDFQRVVSGPRLLSTSSFVGFAQPGAGTRSRLGVAVSRRIKGAVARNRARRRLREAIRLSLEPDGSLSGARGIKVDVVLIARDRALLAPLAQLQAEISRLAAKVAGL
jgi:ribonuclease P protein component